MRIEFTMDKAGLFWSGLGVSLHVARNGRAPEEAFAWIGERSQQGRSFRLGSFSGAVSRA